jgi:hypothetical protein
MRIDLNAFLGDYPFRRVPGGTPEALLAAMDRVGTDRAWISNLAAVFWRDPMEGNAALFQAAAKHERLRPVPAVHPALPRWESALAEAAAEKAPCVRCDPGFYGLGPIGSEMRALAAECGARGIPLMMAVRLEDVRQRHPNDRSEELAPWAVRGLVRADPRVRLIITHADREFVEQVHFGSTPEEAARILWDISWIWGPPEDHLGLLLQTIGVERFGFGTGMPMRIPETSVAKLDLLEPDAKVRARIEAGNVEAFLSGSAPRPATGRAAP